MDIKHDSHTLGKIDVLSPSSPGASGTIFSGSVPFTFNDEDKVFVGPFGNIEVQVTNNTIYQLEALIFCDDKIVGDFMCSPGKNRINRWGNGKMLEFCDRAAAESVSKELAKKNSIGKFVFNINFHDRVFLRDTAREAPSEARRDTAREAPGEARRDTAREAPGEARRDTRINELQEFGMLKTINEYTLIDWLKKVKEKTGKDNLFDISKLLGYPIINNLAYHDTATDIIEVEFSYRIAESGNIESTIKEKYFMDNTWSKEAKEEFLRESWQFKSRIEGYNAYTTIIFLNDNNAQVIVRKYMEEGENSDSEESAGYEGCKESWGDSYELAAAAAAGATAGSTGRESRRAHYSDGGGGGGGSSTYTSPSSAGSLSNYTNIVPFMDNSRSLARGKAGTAVEGKFAGMYDTWKGTTYPYTRLEPIEFSLEGEAIDQL